MLVRGVGAAMLYVHFIVFALFTCLFSLAPELQFELSLIDKKIEAAGNNNDNAASSLMEQYDLITHYIRKQ